MDIRNPIFTSDGRIDCEIDHPIYGWIPFTADENDVEEHGRDVYAAAILMGPAEFVSSAPTPIFVPQSISFTQLIIGLVTEQWITEAEGDAWLTGTLPSAVLTLIDSLPTDQRFAAKAKAIRPSEILRDDYLVNAMATAAGKTEEDIDQFFITYSGV